MTKLQLDILDKDRQEFWNALSVLSRSGGVLGGGTAIALQIGHRESRDFDVFLQKEITPELRKKAFSLAGRPVTVQTDNPEQLTLISRASGIKMTLLYYPFPALHPTIKNGGLPLFSLMDLASSKAYTIGRRGTWRDYVDIYFLLQEEKVNLKLVIDDTQQRFGDEFNPRLFLQQLTYTQDLGEFEIEFLKARVTPHQISKFFEIEAKKYVKITL